MKLNNQQIKAIALKIDKELRDSFNSRLSAYNKEVKILTDKLTNKNSVTKEMNSIVDKYGNKDASIIALLINYLKNKYKTQYDILNVKHKIGDKLYYQSVTDEIERDIIIETIEVQNIEQLIQKLKIKYSV